MVSLLGLCVRDNELKLRFFCIGLHLRRRKPSRLYFFCTSLLLDIYFSLAIATAGAFVLALGGRRKQSYQSVEFHGLVCTGEERNKH